MKNPLQSLLILCALSLCALCTWQWYSQVLQRKEMNGLAQTNYDQTVAVQGYTNTISNMDHQIAQMDARITELREIARSNTVEAAGLRQESARLTSVVDQYSNAVVVLQAQIKIANDNIRQQNEAMKGLVAERDQYVTRLNESIKERNEVVTQYNDLVKKVEAMQAAPPKKPQK
jgi:chromosome segregation ATPase